MCYSNDTKNSSWALLESSFWPLFLSQLTFFAEGERTKMMGALERAERCGVSEREKRLCHCSRAVRDDDKNAALVSFLASV